MSGERQCLHSSPWEPQTKERQYSTRLPLIHCFPRLWYHLVGQGERAQSRRDCARSLMSDSLCVFTAQIIFTSGFLATPYMTKQGNPCQDHQREAGIEKEREGVGVGWLRRHCHATKPSVNLLHIPNSGLASVQSIACRMASYISL